MSKFIKMECLAKSPHFCSGGVHISAWVPYGEVDIIMYI